MRILCIVTSVNSPDEVLQRQRQIPSGLLDPDTVLVFKTVAFSGHKSETFYDDCISEAAVLQAGIDAEADGFDAVYIDSVSDVGLFPLRSRLRIPVVAPGQVAYHVASLLGARFSIIASWPQWEHFYRRNLRLYGMEAKLASIRFTGTRPTSVLSTFAGPSATKNIEAVVAQGRLAIEQDGADVLMLGSTSMAPSFSYLQAAVDVPVVSPGPWACKVAETLVKLRTGHSKRTFASPEVNSDALIRAFPASGRSET